MENRRDFPRWWRRAIAAAALGLAAAVALSAQTASLEGRRVTAIRVVGDAGKVLAENLPGLALAPGGPYTTEAERETLRQLFRTGLYADIRTEATPEAEGVRLDFVVRQNYFLNVVRVEGLREPPNEAQALAALNLSLGETFDASGLSGALDRLQQTLRDGGFYEAKVTRELNPHPETRQMDVLVNITSGPRAGLGKIDVLNHTEFSDRELLRRSRLKRGHKVTARRLDRASERVRKFLVKKDHLGARVVLRRGDYDQRLHTLPLVLDATAGPSVRVEVRGARISQAKLHDLVPIYEEGAVDLDLLQEGRRNIRDYLERQGYFNSDVSFTTRTDPKTSAEVIVYEVERGPRRRLVGIAFEGNHYFDEDLLSSRLTIQAAGFLSRGHFSPRLLQDDENSIQQIYFANGFEDVKVHAEVLENYAKRQGDLFVRFHIEEGSQTRVAALEFVGNHALSAEELLSAVGSTPGQPYSSATVSSDRDNILALYYNEGYPQANFQYEVAPAGQPNRVALIYRISEGPEVTVDQVLISGYIHTRPGVIRREVQVRPSEPLREGDVVETQRRLYSLGIFNRVQVATQNPNGSDPDKTVLVNVTEGKRYTLGYGGGVEVQRLGGSGSSPVGGSLSVSPLGIFEISKSNFGGRAQTLGFKLRASTLQYRGLVSFSAPHFLTNPKFNLLLTGFADKTRDVRTFTAQRYEGSIQVVQNYSRSSSLLYRYSFRHVLVNADSLHVAPAEIPLFSQPTKISAFGITWVRDRRDNPADATRGSFNTADLSVATKTIGSSASFARLFVQNSTYHPLGRSLVLARSVRFGVEQPFSGTSAIQIPLPERFFAGGGSTLRGFALNQAGPRDTTTGFPIGGLALLMFNQELRFPMQLPFIGGRLGGALFYDAGNVFGRLTQTTFAASPPSPFDLNYFSHTVGFGFRYRTPIGPVRLDLGYQLNPAQFSLSCTRGTAGCPSGQTIARLPHFQFFFNIGSIF